MKASIGRIVAEAKALREIGIGTIAIMSNDTETYHEDSFDNMKASAAKHDFTFPYVIDAPRRRREPMTPSARPTSTASTRRMNCNIEAGSTPRAYSRWQIPAEIYSKQ